jgi:hypothetical protein
VHCKIRSTQRKPGSSLQKMGRCKRKSKRNKICELAAPNASATSAKRIRAVGNSCMFGSGHGRGLRGLSSVSLLVGLKVGRKPPKRSGLSHPPDLKSTPNTTRSSPSGLNARTRVLGPETQHEIITPNLARRPPRCSPQGTCRTSARLSLLLLLRNSCCVPRCAVRTWIGTHGHGRMRWPRAHR